MNIVIGLGLGLVVGAVGMLVLAKQVHKEIVFEKIDETIDKCKKAYQEIIDELVEDCNRALNVGETLKEQLEEKSLIAVDLAIKNRELRHQLEESRRCYADLLEEQYDNVISIYKNR